jgi:uncharacterized C2H2 Zn-finger protein
MPRKKFKCPKCDRKFSMAAHLARHTSTMHGMKSKTKKASKKRAGRRKKGARRMGPPSGIERKFGVRNMSLDQLGNLIAAARAAARDKIAAFENQL